MVVKDIFVAGFVGLIKTSSFSNELLEEVSRDFEE